MGKTKNPDRINTSEQPSAPGKPKALFASWVLWRHSLSTHWAGALKRMQSLRWQWGIPFAFIGPCLDAKNPTGEKNSNISAIVLEQVH